MAKMRLKCGSVDLIVTPAGEVVFLEINEQGQFLFLEQQNPELQMMRAVCQFLAKEAGMVANGNWPDFSAYYASSDYLLLREQQKAMGNSHIEAPIRYSFQ